MAATAVRTILYLRLDDFNKPDSVLLFVRMVPLGVVPTQAMCLAVGVIQSPDPFT
jgi:hypothetical protein